LISSGKFDFSALIADHGECECGRRHTVRTQCIRIGHDALRSLDEALCEGNLCGTALLLVDETTYKASGAQAEKAFAAAGSGIINDSCRFAEKRTGLPYIIIGTVPCPTNRQAEWPCPGAC
jgi:glycerol dehydrogenase-like iron-containing ADH family enzyme